jgi:hypothetical protein
MINLATAAAVWAGHLAVLPADGFPNVTPSYDFPVFTLLKRILSWVLGGGTMVVFLALIIAIVAVVFKGFGNERLRGMAVSNIGFIIAGVVVLSGITGIFAWTQGLDLGFAAAK